MNTMPSIFVGHGSPMLAIEDTMITRRLSEVGEQIIRNYGQPKAILMISAHWYKDRNLVQKSDNPVQIYDMYGFPQALYEVKYEPKGCAALDDAVLAMKGVGARVDNTWGIDHGAWAPLVHLFPGATTPVVQLSVNGAIPPRRCYEIGRQLSSLRSQGYLIIGSGNVVHNLRRVNWGSQEGSPEAVAFNAYITSAVEKRDDESVINFNLHPASSYAVPTAEHFLPLIYVLGASEGKKVTVFNKHIELDSMAMTSYLIEQE